MDGPTSSLPWMNSCKFFFCFFFFWSMNSCKVQAFDFGRHIQCRPKLPCLGWYNVCCPTALIIWATHILSPSVFYTFLRCTFLQIDRLNLAYLFNFTNADGLIRLKFVEPKFYQNGPLPLVLLISVFIWIIKFKSSFPDSGGLIMFGV